MKRYVGVDPSTQTGLVILNESGDLIDCMEITAKGKDPERMAEIIFKTLEQIEYSDRVTIEGFGFASRYGFLLGGLGWGMRLGLYERGVRYTEVAPAALKRFTGAKGNAKKDEMAVEIFKRWGFEHKSDNVRDAFVLAQIGRFIGEGIDGTKFQQKIIQTILGGIEKRKTKALR
ncbi:hypothetical protein [Ferviditalea candida]|uniref:Uncharacterized protein n=1 Tax=Ferviditalea candida TaxID=3108399 RepID=A0ABU5ZKL6_9BACL|nr:hypothetical protein [Paenibacillaceae bacterium T2]